MKEKTDGIRNFGKMLLKRCFDLRFDLRFDLEFDLKFDLRFDLKFDLEQEDVGIVLGF